MILSYKATRNYEKCPMHPGLPEEQEVLQIIKELNPVGEFVYTSPGQHHGIEIFKTYAGQVVGRYSETIQVMSDIWETGIFASVWLPEEQRELPYHNFMVGFAEIDRGHKFSVIVDAPMEMIKLWKSAVQAELDRSNAARAAWLKKKDDELQERLRKAPSKNKIVEVVKGRKVPLGTIGKVLYEKEDKYGRSVLIATSNRQAPTNKNGITYNNYIDTLWVNESNVQVLGSQSDVSLELARWAFETKQPVKVVLETSEQSFVLDALRDKLDSPELTLNTRLGMLITETKKYLELDSDTP